MNIIKNTDGAQAALSVVITAAAALFNRVPTLL